MNFQQLEYVIAVDKFRHFAKAAEYCNVTQPTLSSMIQRLEEELGIKIFDRSVTPVEPTSIGKSVIGQARETLSGASRIREIIEEQKTDMEGSFRFAVLPTVAPYLLPRFFPDFMDRYPMLDARVVEMKTNDCLKALLERRVDAAIIATEPDDEKLYVSYPLYYEPFYGYVSKKDPLSGKSVIKSADVGSSRLWLLDEGHCFRDQLVKFCQLKSVRMSQIAYDVGSMETFMRMVEGGWGVTFIPGLALLQLDENQMGMVRPFAIPRPVRRVIMVVRRDFIRHRLLSTLIGAIKDAVPGEMLSLGRDQKLV